MSFEGFRERRASIFLTFGPSRIFITSLFAILELPLRRASFTAAFASRTARPTSFPLSRINLSPAHLPRLFGHTAASKMSELETQPASEHKKLGGREWWDSIGRPKYVVAPMVDQSELVSRQRAIMHLRLHQRSLHVSHVISAVDGGGWIFAEIGDSVSVAVHRS